MQEFGVGSILDTPSGDFEEEALSEQEQREGIASNINWNYTKLFFPLLSLRSFEDNLEIFDYSKWEVRNDSKIFERGLFTHILYFQKICQNFHQNDKSGGGYC